MSSIYLDALKPGQTARILQLHTEVELRQRLFALGFRTGRQIAMLRWGWLSGPLHVRIGTTEVMLRRQEARNIEVDHVNTSILLAVNSGGVL